MAHTPYHDVGWRLLAIREAVGLPQAQEFAKSIGVKKSTYSEYEAGKKEITLRPARRLRAKYGVPLDWIFEGALEEKLPADILAYVREKRRRAA